MVPGNSQAGCPAAALEIDGVSKRFYRDLRRSQWRGLVSIANELRGKDASSEAEDGEFWAVRDVSLRATPGESCGILGRNGAGKSTLLRLAAGILRPDAGRIRSTGRVALLADPGSAFEPVLSGSANLDAAFMIIAGRAPNPSEVRAIIEFSGLGDRMQTPVRMYSRGMRLRLAFSIAVHATPDVLLIDEALAVGDTAFQLRCLDELQRLLHEGTAIVFVSHSLWLFQRLATTGILLNGGQVAYSGTPMDVAERYIHEMQRGSWSDATADEGLLGRELVVPVSTPGEVEVVQERPVRVAAVRIRGLEGESAVARSGQPALLEFHLDSSEHFDSAELAFTVWTADLAVCVTGGLSGEVDRGNDDGSFALPVGRTVLSVTIPSLPLSHGTYMVRVGVYEMPTSDVIALHGYEDLPSLIELSDGRDRTPEGERGAIPLRAMQVEVAVSSAQTR